ncbi:MAG: ABC transporter substrate-binding protein [Pseudomonadota bacterium]
MSTKRIKEQRVASLLPSATEIVALLDCADRLVGISHECDYPKAVRDKPVLTRSRLQDSGDSLAIDRDVRQHLEDALSLYAVDVDALRIASPNLVITQDLCEVCAVSLDDVRSAVARMAQREDVDIVTIAPTRLVHVLHDIELIARAMDCEARGSEVVSELRDRIDRIAARAKRAYERPRVVTIEWLDPLMLGGTWMPELIELAGGQAVGATAGAPAPTVNLSELAALQPDIVVLKPCGFSVARSLQESDLIQQIAAAVSIDTSIFVADGNAYFNRSGPRLVESLEILAACIHPEVFEDFGILHRDSFQKMYSPTPV